MNKIFNWTFGSIFRTLGRIICYLVVGVLLGLFLSKNNVKITDLLGIQRVYASEKVTLNKGTWRMRKDDNGSYSWSSGEFQFISDETNLVPVSNSDHDWLDGVMVRVGTNSKFLRGQSYRVSINMITDPTFGARPLREVRCGGSSTSSWSSNESLISECNQGGYLTYDDGKKTSYYVDVTPNADVYGLQVQIYFNRNLALYGPWLFRGMAVLTSTNVTYNKDSTQAIEQQTNIINNQFNETNQNINNVNDSINDLNDNINNDNVDGASTTASSFFSNFSTNDHGLSGIITAPLNAIQGLLNKRCTPLSLPIPFIDSGDTLDLPCMRDIYLGWFGDFMTLYDVIVDGIVAYWILVRLFAMVKDFKNPNHDEIEVMEL